MTEPKIVPDRCLYLLLARLRDVRNWAGESNVDPWAFRQAMITVLELDTWTALESGVKPDTLDEFDAEAKKQAREFVRRLPG